MIVNDAELKTTLDRIDTFRRQVTELRQKETNPENYRLAYPATSLKSIA